MRVIFRATFQGPKGALNPMKLNMPKVEMTVDVFRTGENWRAKSNGNPLKLGAEPSHGGMKDAVAACFDSQVSKWQMCRSEDAVPLDADYVEEDPKGNFSMREVTHVSSKAQTAHTVNGPNILHDGVRSGSPRQADPQLPKPARAALQDLQAGMGQDTGRGEI